MTKRRNYYILMKNDINKMLEEYKQNIRIVELSRTTCVLNNDLVLDNKQRNILFKIYNNAFYIYKENADYILEDIDNIYKKYQEIYEKCKKLYSKGHIPWNKGIHYHRKFPFTDLERLHHSECKRGSKNPMYGKYHDEEYKRIWSERMKNKILNGEFTPNTNNRLTHYDIKYNEITFRSSWEVLFYHNNPEYEYEKLRIPYYYENKKHIYIVDFVNHSTKTAVEIKPKDILKRNDKDKAKIDALTEWCKENNYTLKLIFDEDIKEMVNKTDISVFDEKTQQKLLKLVSQNAINKKN